MIHNIYKISSINCEKVYIGITKNDIESRLKQHVYCYELFKKNNKNYITSFEILKNGDFKIELLESFIPRDDLDKKESEGNHIKINILKIELRKNGQKKTGTESKNTN